MPSTQEQAMQSTFFECRVAYHYLLSLVLEACSELELHLGYIAKESGIHEYCGLLTNQITKQTIFPKTSLWHVTLLLSKCHLFCISLIRCCGYYFSLLILVQLLFEGSVYFVGKLPDSNDA